MTHIDPDAAVTAAIAALLAARKAQDAQERMQQEHAWLVNIAHDLAELPDENCRVCGKRQGHDYNCVVFRAKVFFDEPE